MAQVIGAVLGATGNAGQKETSQNNPNQGQGQISNAGQGNAPDINQADVKDAATNKPTEAPQAEQKSDTGSSSVDVDKWRNIAETVKGLTQSSPSQNVVAQPAASGGAVANFR